MTDERFELFLVVLITAGVAGVLGFVAGRRSVPPVRVEHVMPLVIPEGVSMPLDVRTAVYRAGRIDL